jgi:hypothetical protein
MQILTTRLSHHLALSHLVLAAAFLLTAAIGNHALADDDYPFIGVITADSVFVRSGPADSYYPIGRVNIGDMVKVVGERFGWARVHATGPTFERTEFFGYVIYPKTQPGRFRLDADGKSGRTLGRTDVLAPNLNTNFDPNDSWKPLIRLEADQPVRVLRTTESANNLVHRIALPAEAEVWISARFVRRADARERETWKRHFMSEEEKLAQDAAAQTPATETPQPRPQPPAQQPQPERRADQPRPTEQPRAEQPQSEPPAGQPPLAREERPAPTIERPTERTEPQTETPASETAPEERPAAPAQPRTEPEHEEPPTTADRLAQVTLADLEEAFERLRTEPIETSEVGPLRRMYVDFASRTDDESAKRIAEHRAEQLALWAELQQGRQRLAQLQARSDRTADRARALQVYVDEAGDYTAVGRLAVSTIYDGRRLPRLFRLLDEPTRRTVAYLQPTDDFDLIGMIDQHIGVIGDKEFDGGLRLNLIRPRRVDLLPPQR